MQSGEECYRRFLDGDKSGFDELMDIYHDSLIRFVQRYVKSEADAEDIAADTFLELLIHPKRYSFKSSMKTYIFSVAHNKSVNFLRKNGRIADFDIEALADMSISDIGGADEIEKSEMQMTVQKALGKINGEYAEVLYLIYFEGLGTDDAARVMKKNKKQISNLIYRAKAAMKQELERGGFSYDGQG